MSMQPQPEVRALEPGVEYINQTEALQQELKHAMLAIAGNSLSVFEESLWRQQVLCTSLTRLSSSLNSSEIETPLMRRIQSSNAALHQLNRCYATLLEHSQHSAELLSTLCRGYKDADPSADHVRSSLRTWSCEV